MTFVHKSCHHPSPPLHRNHTCRPLLIILVLESILLIVIKVPGKLLVTLVVLVVISVVILLKLAVVTVLFLPSLLVNFAKSLQDLLRHLVIALSPSLQVIGAHEIMHVVPVTFFDDLVVALVVGLERGRERKWRRHDDGWNSKKSLVRRMR